MSCPSGSLVAAYRRMCQTEKIPAQAHYKHLQTVLFASSEGCSHTQICLISNFQPFFFNLFLVSMVACISWIILVMCYVEKSLSLALIIHWLLPWDFLPPPPPSPPHPQHNKSFHIRLLCPMWNFVETSHNLLFTTVFHFIPVIPLY